MKLSNPNILIVPLANLAQRQTYVIHHICSGLQLSEIQESLKIRKLQNFSFQGRLNQSKKKNYELHLSFRATIIQNCVITNEPVKTSLNDKIDRYYLDEYPEPNKESLSLDMRSKDIELIHNELDIGAVAIEALCLKIPDYPRKKNVQFHGLTITDSGVKPIDKTLINPFSVLKNFYTK
jgi:uncharacterized metal-binding protein YceD (DUF177 family)